MPIVLRSNSSPRGILPHDLGQRYIDWEHDAFTRSLRRFFLARRASCVLKGLLPAHAMFKRRLSFIASPGLRLRSAFLRTPFGPQGRTSVIQ